MSPLRAALLGAAFLALDSKDWLVDISVINLITNADLSGPDSLIVFLVYILLAQLLLLIPLVLSFIFPQRAQSGLARFNAWMRRHQRAIENVFAVIFGRLFLYSGLNLL